MIRYIKFKGLLQNDGWTIPAIVGVDEAGKIVSIDDSDDNIQIDEFVDGFALPGFQNAHSHAFQYAMAGLAEKHATGKEADDFWSWREAMYSLALSITPDELESIATMLYAEMLRHGYTHVAEFHYIHHDKFGQQYSNLSEMGERLVKAAKNVGIGITLIPIFYQMGGFGKPPAEGQRRFISKDIDAYMNLFEASKASCKHYELANVAYGLHSMRGVDPKTMLEFNKQLTGKYPVHIHIAEQLKEIEDSLDYLDARPVEWLLDNMTVTRDFHLVHATHLTDDECDGIAKSGACVVLCPSTEGNLGDGIFPLKRFQDFGGKWSIGTDSHVGLNPFEELRILDYGQRLTSHKRNTFTSSTEGNSGHYAIGQVTLNGRKAMNNFEEDYFKVGESFDALIMDADPPLIHLNNEDNLLNAMIYSSDASMHYGTMVGGKWKVKHGKHINHEHILLDFYAVIRSLENR